MKRLGDLVGPRIAGRAGLVAMLAATAAGASGHDAVVAIESPAALVAKFVEVLREAAPDAGLPADGRRFTAELAAGPLAGVDLERPAGAFASAPETAGGPGLSAIAIPITTIEDLLGSLERFGATVARERTMPGFSHRVSFPLLGGVPLFLLATRDYAYLTAEPTDAAALRRTKPEDWVPDRADAGDVSFTLRIDELPRGLVDMLVEQLERDAESGDELLPGEDDLEYRSRMLGQRLAARGMASLVREGQTLSVDLSIDRDAGVVVAAGRLSARPGSQLAATLTGFDRLRSRFSALAPDAPLAAWMALPVPEEIRDLVRESVREAMAEAAPENDEQRRMLRDMLAIAEATIEQDVQDVGVAMLAPAPRRDTYSLAAAAAMVDGREANALLERIAAEANDADLQVGAGRAGDGTAIHRLEVPVDSAMHRVYGDAAVWVGFHDDAIALALGEGKVGRAAVDRGLAAADGGRGSDSPIGAVLRVGGLAALAGEDVPVEVAAETFQGENAGRDGIRLLVGGKRGDLRMKITIDVPVVAFVAALVQRSGAEAVEAP